MQYLPELLTVAVIHLFGVMSPGPDFLMISRNSLIYSRKAGVYSALGLGLGIGVHVVYSLVGIGFIIAKSMLLFSVIKYIGAAYLVYIGYKSLRAKRDVKSAETSDTTSDLSKSEAVKLGFITNITNPKVTLFFLALFTQVISLQTPLMIQVLYGLEMMIMTFLWFSIVALVLSHKSIKQRFSSIQHYLEKAFGVVLVALGIKVALSDFK